MEDQPPMSIVSHPWEPLAWHKEWTSTDSIAADPEYFDTCLKNTNRETPKVMRQIQMEGLW